MIKNIFSSKFKKKIAIIDDKNNKYSYWQINEDLNNYNFILKDKGICFLEGANQYESIVFYLFCLKFKIPIFLVEKLNEIHQSKLINEYKPKYIVSKNLIKNKNYILEFCLDNLNVYKYIYIINFKINNKIAILLTTSGTMGNKKFVKISLKNITKNAKQIQEYLKINSKSITITTLPFNYSYGLSIINSHLISGAKIILNNSSVISRDFKNKLNNYKVTNFGGVPYTYSLLNKINFFKDKFKHLEYVTQAGGKLKTQDCELLLDYAKLNKFQFIIMYGQTEASPRISYLPFKNLSDKIGSIGIPIPGGKIDILDKKRKKVINPFQEGEIVYRGSNVSLGLVTKKIDLLIGDEFNGILRTGDIGYFDNENFFYITGRVNRFAKIFGKRINLDHIQSIINKKFISICLSDDEHLIIYYDLNYSKSDIVNELVEYTGLNKNFILVYKVKKLERNTSGKIIIKNYKNV